MSHRAPNASLTLDPADGLHVDGREDLAAEWAAPGSSL